MIVFSVFDWMLIIAAAVLQILLIVKFWRMCNDVRELKDDLKEDRANRVATEEGKNEYEAMDNMLAYVASGGENFQRELFFAIYNDLYKAGDRFDEIQGKWMKLCSAKGWEFPKELAINSMEFISRFRARYIH